MKKVLKTIIIILILCIVLILLDTIQARIRKASPLISWKDKIKNTDSYIDRGIIIDTYYCVNDDTVEVKWKLKTNSYKCPLKENKKETESNKKYIGEWIADGTQIKAIISKDSDGNPIYADDYDEPYNLIVNEDNTYVLKLNNNFKDEAGTYQTTDTEITFKPTNGNFIWYCNLNNEKLECNLYANPFTKVK